ncbi:MAG: glycosyltransferase family 2 protein [Armatimonadota bacterium]|nr:glycosyltransferase family 2 protein [Armatimonadota bacterium]
MKDISPQTPQLSLCLPTYNRAALLGQALYAVLSQIGQEEAARVEVLVLDNASSDETPAVAEEAGRQSPHIPLRYIRNPENLGPDGNFLKAIQMARGDFIYLLSDDDILLPGAVAKLLELIRKHPDFDGFSLNARGFRHSVEEPGTPCLPIAEDMTIRDRDEVLRLAQTAIGFMSILAFNKSRIADRLAAGYYTDKIGTYYLQSYLFLDVLAGGNGFAATAQPLVAQRAENSTRLDYFRVFVTEMHALLMYAQHSGYSRRVIREIERGNLVVVRHFVSRVKVYGIGTEYWSSRGDAIRRLFAVYRFRPYLWLVVVPLMFFPRPLRPLVHLGRRLLGRAPIAEKKAERKESAHAASSGKAH